MLLSSLSLRIRYTGADLCKAGADAASTVPVGGLRPGFSGLGSIPSSSEMGSDPFSSSSEGGDRVAPAPTRRSTRATRAAVAAADNPSLAPSPSSSDASEAFASAASDTSDDADDENDEEEDEDDLPPLPLRRATRSPSPFMGFDDMDFE